MKIFDMPRSCFFKKRHFSAANQNMVSADDDPWVSSRQKSQNLAVAFLGFFVPFCVASYILVKNLTPLRRVLFSKSQKFGYRRTFWSLKIKIDFSQSTMSKFWSTKSTQGWIWLIFQNFLKSEIFKK